MQIFYPISNMAGQTVTKQVLHFLETVKANMLESGQIEIISTTTTSSTTARLVITKLPTIQDTKPGIIQNCSWVIDTFSKAQTIAIFFK